GSSSGHCMWNCITHVTAAPMSACAAGRGTRPRLKAGTLSKKPRKKMSDAARTYDVLSRWVEDSMVHGIVNSQPHRSHRGIPGRCSPTYHAKAQSAPNDSNASSTYGDSGYGAIRKGIPTRSPCSAPGISLFVHTTSGPKNGHSPVA